MADGLAVVEAEHGLLERIVDPLDAPVLDEHDADGRVSSTASRSGAFP
jgi:hypothetical protein